MKLKDAVETMRVIVDAYDRFEAEKLKIKNKTQKFLKGGKTMKFGTVLGIVVGALTLIAAGAAAVYFLTKKKGCCCEEDCCCDCCDDIYDEYYPEDSCEPIVEASAEEQENTPF